MIFDCFTFFNELDLLEIRLRLLDEVVDYFVLCEAPFTFRGAPKDLVFSQAGSRFEQWSSKIIHLVYNGPVQEDPWHNEWGQRDFLIDGLSRAGPEDLILLGDCDEIPAPANVAARPVKRMLLGHRQRLSQGWVNRVQGTWVGTRSLVRRNIARYGALSDVRKQPESDIEIVDGGWHFSSFGGADVMKTKLHSFAHSEMDIPYVTDARRLHVEFDEAAGSFTWIPLDDSFPALFREPRWARYVAPAPSALDARTGKALGHIHGCFAYVPSGANQIAVLAWDDVPLWERAGRERFGARFRGVATAVDDLPAASANGWLVVDGLERLDRPSAAALAARKCGIVAYGRNARSFLVFERVLAGGTFPAGEALGLSELRERMRIAGGEPERTDRIRSQDVFAVWSQIPEMLHTVVLGSNLRFEQISRDDMNDFLTHGIVMTSERNGLA